MSQLRQVLLLACALAAAGPARAVRRVPETWTSGDADADDAGPTYQVPGPYIPPRSVVEESLIIDGTPSNRNGRIDEDPNDPFNLGGPLTAISEHLGPLYADSKPVEVATYLGSSAASESNYGVPSYPDSSSSYPDSSAVALYAPPAPYHRGRPGPYRRGYAPMRKSAFSLLPALVIFFPIMILAGLVASLSLASRRSGFGVAAALSRPQQQQQESNNNNDNNNNLNAQLLSQLLSANNIPFIIINTNATGRFFDGFR